MGKFFNKYIIIIFGFLAIWLGVLPVFISKALPVICENLSYNTEYNITVENPRIFFNILPEIRIKADKFEITKKNTDDRLFINNLNTKIRLLPLITGRIHINYIWIDNFDMKAMLAKDPALDKNFLLDLSKTKVKIDSFKINDLLVVLHEEGAPKPAIYSAKDIMYRKNSRYIKLNLDSKIMVEDKASSAKINLFLPRNNDIKNSYVDVKIHNFDLAPLGDFMKNYLPNDLVDVRGVVDVDIDKNKLNSSLKNIAIVMKDEGNSMIFPELLEIKSDFSVSNKLLEIHQAHVKSKNIDVSLSGTLADYLEPKFLKTNINLRINKSRTEDFISMMPPIQTIDIDGYKLKNYKFYGDVIANLTIKGDNLEPSINGNMYITNGILTKPIPNAKGASIKLNFIGKYLNFDAVVPASQKEKVWVKGGVELYNVKYSDFRVWSTDNVDLEVAQSKVDPLHEILKFVVGPVPIMDIKGRGNIDIIVKGNRKDPHIWGVFNLLDTKTYFLDMPNLVMTGADAVLTFDDENVVFKLKKGLIDGRSVDINGTATLAGKFDFDVFHKNQELGYLYKAIETSAMLEDIKKMLPKFDAVSGLVNLRLKVYGNISDITDIRFNENLFSKGSLELLKNSVLIQGVNIENLKGIINFDRADADINITANIGKSPLSIKGFIKNSIADVSIAAPVLKLKDVLVSKDSFIRGISNINVNLNGRYRGKIDDIEYDKIDLTAKILGVDKNNKLQVSNGEINMKQGRLSVKNLNGNFTDTKSAFQINVFSENLLTNPVVTGKVVLKDFELPIINNIAKSEIIPKDIKDLINQIRFTKGKINLKADIRSNELNASTDIGGIEFVYTPLELPIKVVNGSIYAKRNYLGLNKINILADGMPILVDGRINNITTKQDFDVYVNSKPQQDFIDKYFNNNKIYPLKLKGDIVYSAMLKGTRENFDVDVETDIAKDSSIYYLGATIGDIENAIKINLDMNVIKRSLFKIKEFSYDKIIDSQSKRKTKLNMLKASGGVEVLKDDIIFNNLRIKTQNPTDARIFNIIFRQANIKQGQFTSDLYFNGKLSNPLLIGNFHIFETNIPFLDTTMKNISFNFKDKYIDISALGEIFGNDIRLKGTMRNSLKVPYYVENAELYTKVLDLNYITDRIKEAQVNEDTILESFGFFDLKNVILKNMKLKANGIKLRNISAENVEAIASLNSKRDMTISHFKFNMASGNLEGSYYYNLNNSKTAVSLKVKDIDANALSYAVFDLENQLYGSLTGDMSLSCNGSSFEDCMKSLNGSSRFNVSNGRMPKLGSLEYLLKAGNLLKGGITGVSINSVIDIITPMKTGEFSNIYGQFSIKNGITEDLEISSKGKDLSLFIAGKYNFSTAEADMDVLGLLSKNISTMFGPIGNVSVNTLFNVIPGVNLEKNSPILDNINKIPMLEFSSKAYRKFVAEVLGNINGENYVKSFKWIN